MLKIEMDNGIKLRTSLEDGKNREFILQKNIVDLEKR